MSPSTIWLIVMVVLVLGELATVGLTFIWFAVGALGGADYSLDGRSNLGFR